MKRPTVAISALVISTFLSTLATMATAGPAAATPAMGTSTGRVSVLPGPVEPANKGDSTAPVVNATGRYVVFTSKARLSPIDSFEFEDVYLRDLLTDQVELISVDPDGTQTAATSTAGAISADGRFVVFSSLSNSLVPGDTNSVADVFIRDRQTDVTERVSVNSAGQQGTTSVFTLPQQMDVSNDGRFVAFQSGSSVFGVTPKSSSNVLVRDRQTSTTEMVSVSSAEALPNQASFDLSMTPNGRYVAFRSGASNLVPSDTNGTTGDIFVRDRTAGTTVMASKSTAGAQTFSVSFDPTISDDGTKVAFISRGSLAPGDLDSIDDVFVRNLTTSSTVKISSDLGGAEADQNAELPVISGDGTTVAWQSLSGEYTPGGGNGKVHVFTRVGTTAITRQSVTTAGALGNGDSSSPSLSKDGRVLVFDSLSANLVTGDTGQRDIFVRRNQEVGPHGTTTAYATAMATHFSGGPNPTLAATMSTRIGQGASPEGQVLLAAHGPFGARRAPLVRLYVAYFKRLPDTSGLEYWLKKLNAATKLDQVSAQFAASSEFKTKYGNTTNTQFVTLVYTNIFDRAPDPSGLAYWVGRLDRGTSRGTVMTNFSESSEGKREFRAPVDTALVSLGLLGKIGPANLMTAVREYMALDSSERGVQRLVESSDYAAVT